MNKKNIGGGPEWFFLAAMLAPSALHASRPLGRKIAHSLVELGQLLEQAINEQEAYEAEENETAVAETAAPSGNVIVTAPEAPKPVVPKAPAAEVATPKPTVSSSETSANLIGQSPAAQPTPVVPVAPMAPVMPKPAGELSKPEPPKPVTEAVKHDGHLGPISSKPIEPGSVAPVAPVAPKPMTEEPKVESPVAPTPVAEVPKPETPVAPKPIAEAPKPETPVAPKLVEEPAKPAVEPPKLAAQETSPVAPKPLVEPPKPMAPAASIESKPEIAKSAVEPPKSVVSDAPKLTVETPNVEASAPQPPAAGTVPPRPAGPPKTLAEALMPKPEPKAGEGFLSVQPGNATELPKPPSMASDPLPSLGDVLAKPVAAAPKEPVAPEATPDLNLPKTTKESGGGLSAEEIAKRFAETDAELAPEVAASPAPAVPAPNPAPAPVAPVAPAAMTPPAVTPPVAPTAPVAPVTPPTAPVMPAGMAPVAPAASAPAGPATSDHESYLKELGIELGEKKAESSHVGEWDFAKQKHMEKQSPPAPAPAPIAATVAAQPTVAPPPPVAPPPIAEAPPVAEEETKSPFVGRANEVMPETTPSVARPKAVDQKKAIKGGFRSRLESKLRRPAPKPKMATTPGQSRAQEVSINAPSASSTPSFDAAVNLPIPRSARERFVVPEGEDLA